VLSGVQCRTAVDAGLAEREFSSMVPLDAEQKERPRMRAFELMDAVWILTGQLGLIVCIGYGTRNLRSPSRTLVAPFREWQARQVPVLVNEDVKRNRA
jgi:hypothetical protein